MDRSTTNPFLPCIEKLDVNTVRSFYIECLYDACQYVVTIIRSFFLIINGIDILVVILAVIASVYVHLLLHSLNNVNQLVFQSNGAHQISVVSDLEIVEPSILIDCL